MIYKTDLFAILAILLILSEHSSVEPSEVSF